MRAWCDSNLKLWGADELNQNVKGSDWEAEVTVHMLSHHRRDHFDHSAWKVFSELINIAFVSLVSIGPLLICSQIRGLKYKHSLDLAVFQPFHGFKKCSEQNKMLSTFTGLLCYNHSPFLARTLSTVCSNSASM